MLQRNYIQAMLFAKRCCFTTYNVLKYIFLLSPTGVVPKGR